MKFLKLLPFVISLFFITTYAQPVKSSDIRIEIISQIKVYEEKIEKLKKMLKIADKEEKKIIKNNIHLLEKKIKKLNSLLEKYENISGTTG